MCVSFSPDAKRDPNLFAQLCLSLITTLFNKCVQSMQILASLLSLQLYFFLKYVNKKIPAIMGLSRTFFSSVLFYELKHTVLGTLTIVFFTQYHHYE